MNSAWVLGRFLPWPQRSRWDGVTASALSGNSNMPPPMEMHACTYMHTRTHTHTHIGQHGLLGPALVGGNSEAGRPAGPQSWPFPSQQRPPGHRSWAIE